LGSEIAQLLACIACGDLGYVIGALLTGMFADIPVHELARVRPEKGTAGELASLLQRDAT
jgi:hypothetical protein